MATGGPSRSARFFKYETKLETFFARDKISPSPRPNTQPRAHQPRRGTKGLAPLRDGGVEAGERDSLMDPGLGTGGEPRKIPYTTIRHLSEGGGDAPDGARGLV